MLLIGSRALLLRCPYNRRWADTDFVATIDEFESFVSKHRDNILSVASQKQASRMIVHMRSPYLGTQIVEFEIAWPGTTAASLLTLVAKDQNTWRPSLYVAGAQSELVSVPSLDVLYTLKLSHRYLKNSPHFQKTMEDLTYMRSLGAMVPLDYVPWLKEREKETYNYSHPKLNVAKDQFFKGDEVPYVYDHDTIHLAMAYPLAPAYTLFKKDDAEVACSKEKFFALSEHERWRSVREEAEVLAIERSIVPLPGALTHEQAFKVALEKVCTSISSGWWREYAYDNYHNIPYRPSYVERFWQHVASGLVKKLPTK